MSYRVETVQVCPFADQDLDGLEDVRLAGEVQGRVAVLEGQNISIKRRRKSRVHPRPVRSLPLILMGVVGGISLDRETLF
jgi:hypothetical protein